MSPKPSSLYESLLQISAGKLDIFTEATDRFVKIGKDANIGETEPRARETK
ncbi:MAG TPA: hypothetical protein VG759_29970 [Candidatus Angelobacter sp.]|nr:hypothetical protein [Candidatus Angelobacter sp.]